MGLLDVLRRLFWGDGSQGGEGSARGYGVEDLANRLGIGIDELRAVRPVYRQFTIPKRSGGIRTISAPDDRLKALQRRILRRLLDRLACHGAAIGFERGHSIVDNAMAHAGKAVVVCMDIKDFFGSTPADRVGRYFQAIGWNREVSALLVRLCTHGGSLPQGAPTSPRLGNLVNCRLRNWHGISKGRASSPALFIWLSLVLKIILDNGIWQSDQTRPREAAFLVRLTTRSNTCSCLDNPVELFADTVLTTQPSRSTMKEVNITWRTTEMGRDLARAEAELDRKKTRVSELKSELSKLEAEVTDLESAVRVFRRLLGDEDGTAGLTDEENYSDTSNESVAVGVGPHDLSGRSIRDCAVTILKESEPQWIPYQEIMRRAIERGYTSARGSNLETIRNSFCSILNRYQNVFERKGNEYRLKQDGD